MRRVAPPAAASNATTPSAAPADGPSSPRAFTVDPSRAIGPKAADPRDVEDAESARDAFAASAVAGLCVALWVTLVLVPLSASLQCATDDAQCRLRGAVIVAALLAALLGFCEAVIGPCSVSGCGFGSFRTTPALRDQMRLCLRTALGNTFGAVLGAAAAAVVIHYAAVAGGFAAATPLINAAISSALATAGDQPLRVLSSSVIAGFLLAAVSNSTRGSGLIQSVPVFCTAVVVVLFDLRLGLVDKSLMSAVVTLNALQPPLVSPPAPFALLNGPLAIMGNIAGAALARAVVDSRTPAAGNTTDTSKHVPTLAS